MADAVPPDPDRPELPDGELLSRTDLNLMARALRQDWPISPAAKTAMLQRAMNLADPTEFMAHVPRRTQLAAMKVIAAFCKLTLEQQKVDLARERFLIDLDDEQTDATGGVDPGRAARALRALNEPPDQPTIDP